MGSHPRIESHRRFSLHGFIDDRVASIDRLRLVADDRHRDGSRHAGAFKGADGRSAHVVDERAGTPGGLARVLPRGPEVDNPLPVAVEHVRADRFCLLQRLVNRELVFEHLFDEACRTSELRS